MGGLYLNFLSIGALISCLVVFVMAAFLFTIKRKSQATISMSWLFLNFGVFISAYIIAQVYYHPDAAYHRWITVGLILPVLAIFNQFLLKFPRLDHPNLARRLFWVQLLVAAGVAFYFINATIDKGRLFFFTGHYWDFDAQFESTIVALFIGFYFLLGLVIAFWRIRVVSGRERQAIVFILAIFAIAVSVPIVTNLFSRTGQIDRGIHQTIFVLVVVTGFFNIFILFINNTKDKTTFMTKIVGVTLVTVLLLMQAISYFTLAVQEDGYDDIHIEKTNRILYTKNFSTDPELEYVNLIDMKGFDKSTRSLKKPSQHVDFGIYQPEYFNTAILEELKLMPEQGFAAQAREYLARQANYFKGYARILTSFIKKEGNDLSKEKLLSMISDIDADNHVHYTKIRGFSDIGFKEAILKYIENNDRESFKPFAMAIQNEVKSDTTEGPELKNEVLKYIAPIKPAGSRLYRESRLIEGTKHGKEHFVAFMQYNRANKIIYEVGFSYKSYRDYIHPLSLLLVISIFVIIIIVVFLLPVFFRGSLVKPLDGLLGGVTEVNKGNLDTVIPIRVTDEIGFLASSFNTMVSSIKEAKQKLQDYAENLEDKVEERTKELKETLSQVQALKKQQDGDYFLTTLLIKPLGVNNSASENVNIDFFVKQKKEFEFRHWKNDIGGDINIAHNITLKDKPHTVFLNADAMGKSMQGAGGALVLGAVFHSIIERTKLSSSQQDLYPERWLRNAFLELHKVFASFDGSMLISLVIGLIDETHGLMYYMNAEHPWTILYRDGKASFIENELDYRKLGTTGVEGELAVRTFRLQPKDVIILGSDGRDDILMGTDEEGTRIINEDEHQILRLIENADGDLEGVYGEINKLGELTDDLSLLRIGFLEVDNKHHRSPVFDQVQPLVREANLAIKKGDLDTAVKHLEEAYRLDESQPEIIQKLAKAFFKMKNYEKAAFYAEDYIYLRPDESEYVYLAAYCYKMQGKYLKATDLGERLRLRDPRQIKNLINLSDIYALQKNFKRADNLIDRVLEIEPDNKKAKDIKKALSSHLSASRT